MTAREILLFNIRTGEEAYKRINSQVEEKKALVETLESGTEDSATLYAELSALSYGAIWLLLQLEQMRGQLALLPEEDVIASNDVDFVSLDELFKRGDFSSGN